MKQQLHPLVLASIVVVAVIALGFYGYRALQPAPYTPSPGAPGSTTAPPGVVAPVSKTSNDPPGYYPTAPPGSTPGIPPASAANTTHQH